MDEEGVVGGVVREPENITLKNPAFPSFTVRDVIEEAHHEARGFIERLDHPEVGARAHAGIPG